MATKKCANGHLYDSSIYGDKCPFCPSQSNATQVINSSEQGGNIKTRIVGNDASTRLLEEENSTHPTIPMNNPIQEDNADGNATVIRHIGGNGLQDTDSGRRLVGLLVSYDTKPSGEVYKIYEGRNIIGRNSSADIVLAKDSNVSGTHLLILYVEAEGIYWAEDQKSSNGTYINGKFVREHQLQTHDIIVIGATKFMFFAIPKF